MHAISHNPAETIPMSTSTSIVTLCRGSRDLRGGVVGLDARWLVSPVLPGGEQLFGDLHGSTNVIDFEMGGGLRRRHEVKLS